MGDAIVHGIPLNFCLRRLEYPAALRANIDGAWIGTIDCNRLNGCAFRAMAAPGSGDLSDRKRNHQEKAY
jgi:hypothetical protein